MSLTDEDLRRIRDEIGDLTPPSDDDLADSFEERGSWQAVAVAVLKRRYAALFTTGSAASITIPGVVSVAQSRQESLLAPHLLAQIRRLEAQVLGGGGRIREPYPRIGSRYGSRNIHVELFRL